MQNCPVPPVVHEAPSVEGLLSQLQAAAYQQGRAAQQVDYCDQRIQAIRAEIAKRMEKED